MPERAATAIPTYRLIPRARVDSGWLPTGDRLELYIPRYKDPLLSAILRRVSRPERLWLRYRLDPRASRIYSLIDGYRTVADLVDIYREEFPDDATQVAARVLRLLRSFEDHGFVAIKTI